MAHHFKTFTYSGTGDFFSRLSYVASAKCGHGARESTDVRKNLSVGHQRRLRQTGPACDFERHPCLVLVARPGLSDMSRSVNW
jgi:hypothetical protein